MSLSELVSATGRNKRARAVEFFRNGLTFLSKDDCQGALPYFQKAADADTGYAEAWAQMGFCHEKLGRHSEAIEASKRAVNIRPSAESYFNIGLANYYLKHIATPRLRTVNQSNSILTTPPMLTTRSG
jgi:tetratricopeptide (TPR) repeat protein